MHYAGKELNYDAVTSFVTISLVAYVPDVLVVSASLPVNSLKDLIALAKAGRLKALAAGATSRPPVVPEVPTMAQAAGLQGFEAIDWTGTLTAAGTPKPIADKLSQDMIAAVRSPEVQEKLAAFGYVGVASTSAQFTEQLEQEIARWSALLKTMPKSR